MCVCSCSVWKIRTRTGHGVRGAAAAAAAAAAAGGRGGRMSAERGCQRWMATTFATSMAETAHLAACYILCGWWGCKASIKKPPLTGHGLIEATWMTSMSRTACSRIACAGLQLWQVGMLHAQAIMLAGCTYHTKGGHPLSSAQAAPAPLWDGGLGKSTNPSWSRLILA